MIREILAVMFGMDLGLGLLIALAIVIANC